MKRSKKKSLTHSHSGNRGRRFQGAPGLNLTTVASEAGITLSHLSKIMNGHRTPSLPVAQRLAEALGKSLPEFLDMLPVK